jgi:Ca2+-binding RTX toxin-like protein
MKIRGTGKADALVGSAGDDFFTGGRGADVYIERNGGGHDVITDFNAVEGDRLMVDWYGSYSDITYLGKLTDGLEIHTITGGVIHIGVFDYDHNGSLDTVVSNDFGDSVAILNQPDLYGWALMGG